MSEIHNYDVLIIGAGFAGVHQLLNVRKLGLTVKILEAGHGLAGTWYWNRYPGKDVCHDHCLCVNKISTPIQVPVLTLQCLSTSSLTRRFGKDGRSPKNIQTEEKFKHTSNTLIRNLISVGTCCSILALSLHTGMTLPIDGTLPPRTVRSEFKGLSTFKGEMYHTARWPETHDYKGKRVGVIGTGATGVQVIQEIAPVVAHLTVFQRTPNMTLPMRQRKLDPDEEDKLKKELYAVSFGRRHQTFTGLHFDINPKLMFDATPEERTLFFEEHWEKGGFHFWMGSYADLLLNPKANDEAYGFWRKKVRERIPDPELQEKLAPIQPPHPFGVRRPSLEQSYYEVYSQPNVQLVDVNKTAIEEITPKGLKTSDGVEHELDVLILATGFDMVTGGITSIDIRGQDGIYVLDLWTTVSFLLQQRSQYHCELRSYSCKCIKHMKENNISSIVPTEEAQHAYSELVDQLGAAALWSEAKTSWYMGKNIKGKKAQMLQFSGGIPAYAKLCEDSAAKGYHGFHLKVPA